MIGHSTLLKSVVTVAILRFVARLIVLNALKKKANDMADRILLWGPSIGNESKVAKYRAVSDKYNRMKFFWMKKLPEFPQNRG